MTTRVGRYGFARALLVAAAIGSTLAATPRTASAFCCSRQRAIRLQPVDPTTHLRGTAEFDDCFGVPLLRIRVAGRLADNTQLVPVFPGREPLIGNWITMTGGRGETVWEGLALDTITGRPFAVSDENFTEVLTGQF